MDQTVNLTANAFGGLNPSLTNETCIVHRILILFLGKGVLPSSILE